MCVTAYLIGSLSSAVIVCRLAGLPDPRNAGSKNPGATNVLRLGGKKLALFTLLGDMLKGVLAVLIALLVDPRPIAVGPVMVAVFLGHLYPVFFGFKGGKGVATAFGAIVTVSYSVGGLLFLTWGIIFFLCRLSSLAAIMTALLAPLYAYLFINTFYVIPISIMSILLIIRHRSNLQRLLKGTEPKTEFKKD